MVVINYDEVAEYSAFLLDSESQNEFDELSDLSSETLQLLDANDVEVEKQLAA